MSRDIVLEFEEAAANIANNCSYYRCRSSAKTIIEELRCKTTDDIIELSARIALA